MLVPFIVNGVMNMFGLFKKKAPEETALEKRLRELKVRKISYVDTDFDEFTRLMRSDVKSWLKLKPVNYYATKREYIMGSVYTTPDYSENYVSFERYEQERRTHKSEIYSIDFELLSKALAKVGIIITRHEEEAQ